MGVGGPAPDMVHGDAGASRAHGIPEGLGLRETRGYRLLHQDSLDAVLHGVAGDFGVARAVRGHAQDVGSDLLDHAVVFGIVRDYLSVAGRDLRDGRGFQIADSRDGASDLLVGHEVALAHAAEASDGGAEISEVHDTSATATRVSHMLSQESFSLYTASTAPFQFLPYSSVPPGRFCNGAVVAVYRLRLSCES